MWIATLSRRAEQAVNKVVIVSSDKDLMQLCRDGPSRCSTSMNKEGRSKLFGVAEVIEKWGVEPRISSAMCWR